MARHARAKTSTVQAKIIKIPMDIRYLLIANLVLNIAILYFVKFSWLVVY